MYGPTDHGGMKIKSKIPMKAVPVASAEQNGHGRSETVTLYSKSRTSSGSSVTCQDVRRNGSASSGQTNAKKMALNRSRAIKAFQ